MIKNQNILATLITFLSQLKTFKKKTTRETTCKTATAKIFSAISNRKKKSQINNFTIVRQIVF